MSSGGPFNEVGGLRPKRNFFNLSHFVPLTCEFGKLYPVLIEEMIPGDKFKIGYSAVVRTQPLFAPILQNIKLYVEYFFVPNRILWSDWENFITGGKDGDWSGSLPLWNGRTASSPATAGNYAKDTLADYLSHPLGVNLPLEDTPIAFPQLAYNRIWNEYYRDETIDDEVNEYNQNLLRRRWKKDYFTSALLYPQRGTAPGFSWDVGGTADVLASNLARATVRYDVPETFNFGFWSSNSLSDAYKLRSVDYTDDAQQHSMDSGVMSANKDATVTDTQVALVYNASKNQPVIESVTAKDHNDSNLTRYLRRGYYANFQDQAKIGTANFPNATIGFDIADLRLNVQIQKFLERNMRAGYRLNEFLLAHFGLSPRDSVLQRPEYIGGGRANIVVSEVLQTSSTELDDDGDVVSPQGNLAGRGICVSTEYVNHYTASEHGILMGLLSFMPSNLYDSQGLDKRWQRRTRYDYYFPEFAHLSEQPVKQKELFATNDHEANESTFGYQPVYQEYRHRRSYVVNDFRVGQTLDYWTLARHFDSAPTLSSEFLQVDPPADRIFPVNTQAPFMVQFGNIVKALRPIPLLGEPGLVDHF